MDTLHTYLSALMERGMSKTEAKNDIASLTGVTVRTVDMWLKEARISPPANALISTRLAQIDSSYTAKEAHAMGALVALFDWECHLAYGDPPKTKLSPLMRRELAKSPSKVFAKFIKIRNMMRPSLKSKNRTMWAHTEMLFADLVDKLPAMLPKHNNIDAINAFDIGYYQQKKECYAKKEPLQREE